MPEIKKHVIEVSWLSHARRDSLTINHTVMLLSHLPIKNVVSFTRYVVLGTKLLSLLHQHCNISWLRFWYGGWKSEVVYIISADQDEVQSFCQKSCGWSKEASSWFQLSTWWNALTAGLSWFNSAALFAVPSRWLAFKYRPCSRLIAAWSSSMLASCCPSKDWPADREDLKTLTVVTSRIVWFSSVIQCFAKCLPIK